MAQYVHTEMSNFLGWITQKDLVKFTHQMVPSQLPYTLLSLILIHSRIAAIPFVVVPSVCTINGEAFLGWALIRGPFWDGVPLRIKFRYQGAR
jgi:hypothetical protein